MQNYPKNIFKKIRSILRTFFRYGILSCAWLLMDRLKLLTHKSLKETFLESLLFIYRIMKVKSIRTTVNDVRIYADPRNRWSLQYIVLNPYYDWEYIQAVRHCIPREYTFFDIGANFGVWSFSLADAFPKIIAVEPEVRCYECMTRTKDSKPYSNITLVNAAMSDRNGQGLLFPSSAHLGDGRIYNTREKERGKGTPVNLIDFDTLVEQHSINLDHVFIKLDVQGVEPLVIQGMRKSIQRAKNIILFTEIHNGVLMDAGSSKSAYLELLRDTGFVPVDILGNMEVIEWESVEDHLTNLKDMCFRLQRESI